MNRILERTILTSCEDLALLLASLVLFGFAVWFTVRKNGVMARGMTEAMWLVAPLRVCHLTLFSFPMSGGLQWNESWMFCLGFAVTVPFIETLIFTLPIIALGLLRLPNPKPRRTAMLGILAGICSVLLWHFTMTQSMDEMRIKAFHDANAAQVPTTPRTVP